MMIESNYEVNISLNGYHYCTIEFGNTMESTVMVEARMLKKKFTKEEGYKVTLRHVTCYAEEVEIE